MKTMLSIAVAVSVLALAGCGGDDQSGSNGVATTETSMASPPPPPAPPAPTPPPAPPKAKQIVIVVDGGQPRGGIHRPKIEKGEKIVLVIRSDAGKEVHVHGYDVERPLEPGKTLRIPITATVPGRFEVELHDPDVLLAVLEVRP
jgi:hypothetical protein